MQWWFDKTMETRARAGGTQYAKLCLRRSKGQDYSDVVSQWTSASRVLWYPAITAALIARGPI